MKYSEIMRENFNVIVDKMIEIDAENRPYQVDLYIYPDGTLYDFVNVGGNSWLNDDHYRVWYINNEFSERDGMSSEEIKAECEFDRINYEQILERVIFDARESEDEAERCARYSAEVETW